MSKDNTDKLIDNLEYLKKYFRGKISQNQTQAENVIAKSLEILNDSKK